MRRCCGIIRPVIRLRLTFIMVGIGRNGTQSLATMLQIATTCAPQDIRLGICQIVQPPAPAASPCLRSTFLVIRCSGCDLFRHNKPMKCYEIHNCDKNCKRIEMKNFIYTLLWPDLPLCIIIIAVIIVNFINLRFIKI